MGRNRTGILSIPSENNTIFSSLFLILFPVSIATDYFYFRNPLSYTGIAANGAACIFIIFYFIEAKGGIMFVFDKLRENWRNEIKNKGKAELIRDLQKDGVQIPDRYLNEVRDNKIIENEKNA